MSEKAEALWTVDQLWKLTGDLRKRYLFRTRDAARRFREAHLESPVYRYTVPQRAQWGPEQ